MKKFVYPVVIFKDEEVNVFVSLIDELDIVMEGNSMEEAHQHACEALSDYISAALKYDLFIEEPQTFETVQKKYPGKLVVFAEGVVDDNFNPLYKRPKNA